MLGNIGVFERIRRRYFGKKPEHKYYLVLPERAVGLGAMVISQQSPENIVSYLGLENKVSCKKEIEEKIRNRKY